MAENSKGEHEGVSSDRGQYTGQHHAKDSEEGGATEAGLPYGDWYRERLQSETKEGIGEPPGLSREEGGASSRRSGRVEAAPTTVRIESGASVGLEARGEPVVLSSEAERFLTRNMRELAIVEGRLLGGSDRPKVIGFSSCFDGEGKTTAALGAAYGIGQTGGDRVLLVDANPLRPKLQQLFSVTGGPGLSDVLAGGVPVEDALHPTRYKGLEVITGGNDWAAFGQSLPIARLRAFLDIVRPAFDCVIVDTTSLFTASDAMLSAPLMDGMAITVACEHTKWEALQTAADNVRGAGGRVLGAVLNRRRYYIPKRVYQWLAG